MIIGLGNRSRVGKDTFGLMLKKEFEKIGYLVTMYSIARAVKEIVQVLDPTADVFSDEYKEEYTRFGITGRQLQQTVAEGLRQVLDPEVWVGVIAGRIAKVEMLTNAGQQEVFEEMRAPMSHYVHIITDVRYPEEACWIKSKQGILLRLDRFAPSESHVSDSHSDLIRWDGVITNTKTLDHLAMHAEIITRTINESLTTDLCGHRLSSALQQLYQAQH